MTEKETLQLILEEIERIDKSKMKPLRIAINGIEGTGKTVFAKKLSAFLSAQDKSVLHISIDGFHFNKEHRYRQGKDSAKGYYEDSYDEIGFVEKVLISSQNNPAQITHASHDLETDEYLNISPIEIADDSIIITDGAYLFKPNYREHWDLKIYLKTDFQTAQFRGVQRDEELLGGKEAASQKYKNRYHKASRLYIRENDPEGLADIIIDNCDFEDLKILRYNGLKYKL